MKTFKTIGMACLAIAASINFTACGDEEDEVKNGTGIASKQKRLTKVEVNYSENGDESGERYTFSYDDKGRLIRATEGWEPEANVILFTWENNIITAVYNYSDGTTRTNTYTLTNNLIRKQIYVERDDYTFSYNSSGQIIKMDGFEIQDEENKDCYIFTWNKGNMTKIAYERKYYDAISTEIYEFTYNGKTGKGWFPYFFAIGRELDYIGWACPELFGMCTNQLPERMTYKETYENRYFIEEKTKLDYTLDEDGYVTNGITTTTGMESEDEDGNGVITDDETYTYTHTSHWTLTWE